MKPLTLSAKAISHKAVEQREASKLTDGPKAEIQERQLGAEPPPEDLPRGLSTGGGPEPQATGDLRPC